MGIVQTDILVKTAIEAGLDELRANNYLLDDISASFCGPDISDVEYGQKERKRFKDWFIANNIPVFMQYRMDTPQFPCIVIVDAGSQEMENRAALGDDSGAPYDFDPEMVAFTPDYVYRPFVPAGYDPTTGTVTFPKGTTTVNLFAEMMLVSKTGKAYEVKKITGTTTFQIKPGTRDDFNGAYIARAYSLWNQQREQTFMRQSYSVVCMAESDPVYCNWLHMIVTYILLRGKEVFLEGRGYELSTFSTGPLTLAPRYEPQNVYFKQVNLSGQVENSWIKFIAPKLAGVKGHPAIRIIDGPRTPPSYRPEVQDQAWDMEGDKGDEK